MMVAFTLRQRRGRRAVLLARDSVAVPGPARCRSCSAARASSRSNRTARSSSSAAAGCRGSYCPGFRDIRGYRAMYRDFARPIRTGRAAGDEPRARHRGPATDGPGSTPVAVTSRVASTHPTRLTTSSSSAAAPAAARWRTRWRARRRACSSSSAATSCRRSRRTGTRPPSGSTCATATTERWLDGRGRAFQPVHALRRRRQHEVLGQRALSAAPRGFRGRRARGRRVARLADRLRHARAVLRPRRAAVSGPRRGRARPDRTAARRRFPTRPCRTPPAMAAHRERLRGAGPAPVAAAARPDPAGRARRVRPVQHLQFVSLPARTRRATPRSARVRAGARGGERDAVDAARSPRGSSTDPAGRRVEAVEVERDGDVAQRRGAAGRRLVRRRQLRRAAACARRPTRTPTASPIRPGLVGRRYMAHLATMMQGFHPLRRERRPCSRRPSRSTISTRGPGRDLSARPDPVTGAHARRHGAGRRAVDSARGPTRRGWRAAWTGWRCRRTCRVRDNRVTRRRRRPHPPQLPPNNRGAHRAARAPR